MFTDHFTDFDWGILNAGKVNVAFSKAGKGATDPLVSLYDVSFYNGDPYTNGLGGTLRNAYLKPESVYGFEIGTELGFFDNRITIEGTYYKQTTEDQLQNVPIPGYSGASSRYINVASVENTGIEIVLNTVPVRTDEWTWEIGGTYYTNDNELVNLAEDVEEIGIYEWTNWGVFPRARIGEPLGLIRGNGFKYDESGNKLLNVEGYYVQEADKLLGNINPDFTGNIYSRLTFRNFTLSALVDFRVGGELMSGSYFYGTGRGKIKDTLFGRDAEHGGITYIDANGETRRDGIIPEGVFEKGTFLGKGDAQKDVSGWTYQKAVDKGLVTPLAAWDYYSSLGAWGVGIPEIGIFKAGYVRMKQISITYNVPSDFLKRTPFRRFSASAVGRNLFYFSKDMPIGINPEPLSSSNWQNIYEFNGLPATYEVGFTLRASF